MLVALYALLPVALKLAAIALMWRFPLDRAAHDKLVADIARTVMMPDQTEPFFDQPVARATSGK